VTKHSTNNTMFKGSNIADSLKELPALVVREKKKKFTYKKDAKIIVSAKH
jgi:hypothetical protein